MKRVLIIGSPGAGKSTFARALADRTGLPLTHLDAEYWQPGWVAPGPGDWSKKLDELTAPERWIIDGNYGGSMEMRLARADTVIFLDYHPLRCLWRLMKRVTLLNGRVREDSAPGCPERFDPALFAFVATFRRQKRARIMERIRGSAAQNLVFSGPAQAEAWLAQAGRLAG